MLNKYLCIYEDTFERRYLKMIGHLKKMKLGFLENFDCLVHCLMLHTSTMLYDAVSFCSMYEYMFLIVQRSFSTRWFGEFLTPGAERIRTLTSFRYGQRYNKYFFPWVGKSKTLQLLHFLCNLQVISFIYNCDVSASLFGNL